MKKYLYSILLMLLCTVTGAFAQSMIITGGNDHGIALCNKGQIFAWGYNDGNRLCLLDPADAAKSIVPSPSQVNTGSMTFSQLSGGSGSHSVALSCNKIVYCWGANDAMQCGRPKSDYITGGEPVPVYRGVADGYYLDGKPGGDYLGNVKYISATTQASMAILDDGTGRVVIWGTNKDNIFGAPTYEPVWLTDEFGDPIRNVIHITGGDDNIMLIVGDSPDALVGTVYSSGNWNGRGAMGTALDNIAAPVEIGDGTGKASSGEYLTNVRNAGVSDVGGFAVDGTTGYVYGWGHGAWGCSNGIPNNLDNAYAEKVVAGEYKEISGEPYLTNVKQVIGGNGNGTAVTNDGYVLYWGDNSAAKITACSGGVVPNSKYATVSDLCKTGPVFANYCAGEKGAAEVRVDDAIAIARGDLYGFMVNSNGDFYVWGSTAQPDTKKPMHVGALGIGEERYVSTCFKKIDIDKLCDPQDLCPEAFMVPSRQKCPGEKINLYSGFTPAINREDNYYFYWEKDGVPLNTSTKSSSAADRLADVYNKPEIEIVDPGVYKVTISYVGLNVPCEDCPDVSAEIEITDMPMPIDTIITDMNCVANPRAPSAGDKISFEAVVNNKFYKATDNVTFAAFSTPTSTDTIRIVKTTGAGGQILLPNISGDSVLQVNDNAATTGDTTYSIWLEDITSFETYLFKGAALSAGGNDQKQGLMIEIFSMAHLQSFDVAAKTYYGPGTFTAKPQIYSVDVNDQGNPIKGALYWEGDAQPFDITDVASTHTVVCDVKLPANPSRGTRYILAVALTGSSFQPMQMALNVTQPNNAALFATPIADSEGFGISAVGSLEGTNPGKTSLITNIKFGKLTDYDCGRIELQARLGCPPCNPLDPTSVKIEVSNQTVVKNDTIFLCQESPAVTLSVTAVKGAPSAEAGAKFDILWYNKSLASAAAQTELNKTASTFATSIVWDATKAGTSEKVFLQARDNEEPNGECHEEDSIVIVYNEIPVAPAIADMQFCVNAATADKPNLNDTLATAKFSDFNVTWTNPTAIPDLQGADGATAGTKTYEYTVTSKITGCVSAAATFDVTVLEKPVAPSVKNLDFVVKQGETELVEQGATETTNHTLTWYEKTTKDTYPAAGATASPSVSKDVEGKYSYWVAQISDDGGCISDTVRIDVTVNDAPIPQAVNDTVCLGTSVDVTKLAVAGDPNKPTDSYELVWYNSFGAGKEDSVSASAIIMNPKAVGEQKFYVAQKNKGTGAISNKKEFSVFVYGVEKPQVDVTEINYCAGETANILSATPMKNEPQGYMADKLVWTLNGVDVTTPLPETNVTKDTSYTYSVRQFYTIPTDVNQVCKGDSVDVKVNVTYVPQLTVGSVLYLKSDANADGSFDKDLLEQTENTLITGNREENSTLNWYKEDCITPIIGTPSPTINPATPAGQDQIDKYCVTQTVNGCESKPTEVMVKISDALPPTVIHPIYCEGSVIQDLTAEPSTLPGEDKSNFTLLWYKSQPATVDEEPYSEGPSFKMDNQIATVSNSSVTIVSYWVAQRNETSKAVSTATELKVIVYPKPVVSTVAPDPICGNDGNELDLNNASIWSVTNETNIKSAGVASITPQFFDPQSNSLGTSSSVAVSGTYKIGATYVVASTMGGVEIKDQTCTGTPVDVDVKIHNLTDLKISGVNTTCPSTKVTLTASATSTDPGTISYEWGGDAQGATGDVYTSPDLSNITGTRYSYTVKAIAGACSLEIPAVAAHTVEIGDGPVVGDMVASEQGNGDSPITFNGDSPREFYSCGGDVMLTVNYTKTGNDDYVWYNEAGQEVGKGATYTISSTTFAGDRKFKVVYTNQCPTFAEITIHDIPLAATPVQTGDAVMCEGDQFSVALNYSCAETPAIQWHRDGKNISSVDPVLTIEKTIVDDGGSYSFTVTNRGCTVKGNSMNLKVKPYIKVTDLYNDIIVPRHGNQTITLPITVPASGLVESISWKENGVEVYNGNPYTLTEVVADHRYDISLDDPDHCPASTKVTVLVDAELQLSTDLKDTICLGTTEVLVIDTTGTGPFRQMDVPVFLTVTANDGTQTVDITDDIVKVGNLLHVPLTPSVNTTYTVDYQYGTQHLTSSEKVVVIPAIEVTIPATPTLCEGEQTKLQVTNIRPIGTSVSWVADPTIIDGQDGEILTVQPTYTKGVNHQSVYVYTLIATNSICGTSKSYEVKVNVDEPITGAITGVNAICEGESTMLDASSFQSATYSWEANGSALGVMDVINVSPLTTTTYELNMVRGLCKASASYQVIVSTNPVIMRIDSVALRDREIVLDPSYGTAPYTYAVDSREPDVNSIKRDLSFTAHTAKVVDAAGCTTTQQFIMEPPAISIPEYFSPNGDGTNDTWVCPSLADVYPNALVSIYDRFGKMLIQFLGADANGWDGTYQGVPMPSTDYWYQIDIEEINMQYVGHFTLIRR